MDKIILSHRGNLDGPNPKKENSPEYVRAALDAGFDVEIDLWFKDTGWYLGHDGPTYKVDPVFLWNPNLWVHCKNLKTLGEASMLNSLSPRLYKSNLFFHNTDDGVLTSNGLIWTYPGKYLTWASIAVCPERVEGWDLSVAAGICTDYPKKYK